MTINPDSIPGLRKIYRHLKGRNVQIKSLEKMLADYESRQNQKEKK